jgi:ribonuclease HII
MKALSALLANVSCPETILYDHGYRRVAGVDEAGRGPLAGPVVAAAVILSPGWMHDQIKDSKQLTAAARTRLYTIIDSQALAWGWALVDAEEIDRINILQASLLAMKKAIEGLDSRPDYVIVDGLHPVPLKISQTPIRKGDARSLPIAAASIMAKVIRDAIMHKYHALYPVYNFARHKGYGTAEHLKALNTFGCCPIHRKSFRPVLAAGGRSAG